MNTYKFPKVLVACPTSYLKDYCLDEWLENVNSFNYPNFDIHMVDNSPNGDYLRKLKDIEKRQSNFTCERVSPQTYSEFKEVLAKSHDKCRLKAINGGYKFLLHLESDIIPPIDVIQNLMSHSKKVVGALYHIGLGEDSELMVQLSEGVKFGHDFTYSLGDTDINFVDGTLKKVFSPGLGCVLFTTKLLEKVEFEHQEGAVVHPDSIFYGNLSKKRVPVYVDTSVYCEHKNMPTMRF